MVRTREDLPDGSSAQSAPGRIRIPRRLGRSRRTRRRDGQRRRRAEPTAPRQSVREAGTSRNGRVGVWVDAYPRGLRPGCAPSVTGMRQPGPDDGLGAIDRKLGRWSDSASTLCAVSIATHDVWCGGHHRKAGTAGRTPSPRNSCRDQAAESCPIPRARTRPTKRVARCGRRLWASERRSVPPPTQSASYHAQRPSRRAPHLMPKRTLLFQQSAGKTSIERVEISLAIAHDPIRVNERILERLGWSIRQIRSRRRVCGGQRSCPMFETDSTAGWIDSPLVMHA